MYLTRIELQGFKSFANKTTLLLPEKNNDSFYLTAIVGPNGSGKSNIADAVRFVLGEQKTKVVRGEKTEDLIFFGTQNRPRASMAEISLTFADPENLLATGSQEIKISRRLYRDGVSEYFLNNNLVRLSDIQALLAKANFGKDSYLVIAQGTVDKLLLMTQAERKIFFEEATGVRHLQIKREQALKKLEASLANLQKAKMLLEEITPRLRSLTRQVHRLQDKEKIQTELSQLEKKYYASLLYSIAEEKNQWLNRQKDLQEKIAAINLEIKNLEKSFLEETQSKTESEKLLQIQKEYQNLLDLKKKLQEEELTLRRKKALESTPAKIELEEIVSQIKVIFHRLQEVYQTLQAISKIEDLEKVKIDLSQILADFQQVFSFEKQNQASSTNESSKAIEKITEEIKRINYDLNILEQSLNQLNFEEKKRKSNFLEQQQDFLKKQEERHFLENELNNINIEIAKINLREENLKNEISRYGLVLADKEEILPQDEALALYPQIEKLRRQVELIGCIDPEVVKEYEETRSRAEFLNTQIGDLEKSIRDLSELSSKLEQEIEKQFNEKISKINEKFNEFFKVLFTGGTAKLIKIAEEIEEENPPENIENSEDVESQNALFNKKALNYTIEIQATPPGKKIKSIQTLSGGEKALTAIALLAAILSVNPPPFILLDEVDAALDESNSLRLAEILKELAKKTQLIVITHNRATMQAAKILYGVTMDEQKVSKVFSVKLEEGLEMVKARS